MFHIYNNSAFTNLIITNNWFIGTISSTNAYAIYEDGTADVTNQTLISNFFIINTLGFLYHDFINGDISTGNDWTNINNASFTGATQATTNFITTI